MQVQVRKREGQSGWTLLLIQRYTAGSSFTNNSNATTHNERPAAADVGARAATAQHAAVLEVVLRVVRPWARAVVVACRPPPRSSTSTSADGPRPPSHDVLFGGLSLLPAILLLLERWWWLSCLTGSLAALEAVQHQLLLPLLLLCHCCDLLVLVLARHDVAVVSGISSSATCRCDASTDSRLARVRVSAGYPSCVLFCASSEPKGCVAAGWRSQAGCARGGWRQGGRETDCHSASAGVPHADTETHRLQVWRCDVWFGVYTGTLDAR